MHKTLECRQRGPGKTKIILLCSFLGGIKWLCCCPASSDSSPSMPSVSAWLPVCLPCLPVCDVLRMTARLVSSPSSLGDQIPPSDPRLVFFSSSLSSCLLPFTLFIARWRKGKWMVRGMKCVLECGRLPQGMWEKVQWVHSDLSGLPVCI